MHARAVLTWRDYEQEWSPGRTGESARGRRAIPWGDGFTGQMGWHAVVLMDQTIYDRKVATVLSLSLSTLTIFGFDEGPGMRGDKT